MRCWKFFKLKTRLGINTKFYIDRTDPSGRAVCGRSLAGIAGSNTAEGTNVSLLLVFCVAR